MSQPPLIVSVEAIRARANDKVDRRPEIAAIETALFAVRSNA